MNKFISLSLILSLIALIFLAGCPEKEKCVLSSLEEGECCTDKSGKEICNMPEEKPLSHTYLSQNKLYSFNYFDDWQMAFNEQGITMMIPPQEPAKKKDNLILFNCLPYLGEDFSLDLSLASIGTSYKQQTLELGIGKKEEFLLGDMNAVAVAVIGKNKKTDNPFEVWIVVAANNKVKCSLTAEFLSHKLPLFKDALKTMLSTMKINEDAIFWDYKSESKFYSVKLPLNWDVFFASDQKDHLFLRGENWEIGKGVTLDCNPIPTNNLNKPVDERATELLNGLKESNPSVEEISRKEIVFAEKPAFTLKIKGTNPDLNQTEHAWYAVGEDQGELCVLSAILPEKIIDRLTPTLNLIFENIEVLESTANLDYNYVFTAQHPGKETYFKLRLYADNSFSSWDLPTFTKDTNLSDVRLGNILITGEEEKGIYEIRGEKVYLVYPAQVISVPLDALVGG